MLKHSWLLDTSDVLKFDFQTKIPNFIKRKKIDSFDISGSPTFKQSFK